MHIRPINIFRSTDYVLLSRRGPALGVPTGMREPVALKHDPRVGACDETLLSHPARSSLVGRRADFNSDGDRFSRSYRASGPADLARRSARRFCLDDITQSAIDRLGLDAVETGHGRASLRAIAGCARNLMRHRPHEGL